MYKIVGCIPDSWSEDVETGFTTEEQALVRMKEILTSDSFDLLGFTEQDGSMWIALDD